LGLVFPLAVNFVVVMCPNSSIYTLMAYGFLTVPCLPMVICEALGEESCLRSHGTRLIACLLALLLFYYGYEANVSYAAMHYHNRQMENYYTSLIAQVRMTEGFSTDKKWAFIGSNQDPLLYSGWMDSTKYGGNSNILALRNSYSRHAWMYLYFGYAPPLSTESDIAALIQNDAVRAMPCWPNQGSIKVVDDTVVIKFQELSK